MSSRALDHVKPAYGWTAEGKTPAEIAGDIRQTKYRLDADVQAIKAKLSPRRLKLPAAAVALGLVALLIRRFKR